MHKNLHSFVLPNLYLYEASLPLSFKTTLHTLSKCIPLICIIFLALNLTSQIYISLLAYCNVLKYSVSTVP